MPTDYYPFFMARRLDQRRLYDVCGIVGLWSLLAADSFSRELTCLPRPVFYLETNDVTIASLAQLL